VGERVDQARRFGTVSWLDDVVAGGSGVLLAHPAHPAITARTARSFVGSHRGILSALPIHPDIL